MPKFKVNVEMKDKSCLGYTLSSDCPIYGHHFIIQPFLYEWTMWEIKHLADSSYYILRKMKTTQRRLKHETKFHVPTQGFLNLKPELIVRKISKTNNRKEYA